MKRIFFFWAVLLPLLIAFYLKLTPQAIAQVRPEAATVFTGQIIPAFIGGAYDPSQAFKQLAGLPIYVFAYDAFGGSSQVKGNLVVRTQIRADGSFQVQGLFAGSYYGIYFPFKGYDSDGDGYYDTVVQTDCRDGINRGQPHCPQDAVYTPDGMVVKNVFFRWPESSADPKKNDAILDVFSYKQNDTTALNNGSSIVVHSQLPCNTCRAGFEDVVLDRVFASSTTRLDIANSINVFPVIPIKVLKINVKTEITDIGSSYEVTAQRVARKISTGGTPPTTLVKESSPVIRGRTGPGQSVSTTESLATFQAFAPPGIYAITVWRSGFGAVSYKDWKPNVSINADRHGFAIDLTNTDWRAAFASDHKIPTNNNWIILWGSVTNDDGSLEFNLGSQDKNAQGNYPIQIYSETGLPYLAKKMTEKDFFTFSPTASADESSVYGFYTFFSDPKLGNPKSISLNEEAHVNINKDTYRKNPKSPDATIFGNHGAVRVDLTAKPDRRHSTGYPSGIVIDVTYKGKPVRDADVIVVPLNEQSTHAAPALASSGKIIAAEKSYSTDITGQVHIPHNHLINNNPTNNFLIAITAGTQSSTIAVKNYQRAYDYRAFTGRNEVQLAMINRIPKPYKLLGKIPIPFSIAQAQNFQTTTVHGTMIGLDKVEGLKVYIKRHLLNGTEQTCFQHDGQKLSQDGTCYFEWNPQNLGEFTITFQVPMDMGEQKNLLLKSCAHLFPLPASTTACIAQVMFSPPKGIVVNSYTLQIKGIKAKGGTNGKKYQTDTRFTVDSHGVVSPNQVTLNFNLDCDEAYKDNVLWAVPTFSTIINRSACNFTLMVADHAPGLIGDFQRQFLQIRPLTDAPGIVQLWNMIRGLTNIFFIVFLILIGFATILGWDPKTWSLRLLLPRLLVAIVLANFSLLIVQLLLDVNNVATQTIFNLSGNLLKNMKPIGTGSIIPATGPMSGNTVNAMGVLLASGLATGLYSTLATGVATGGLSFVPILISLSGIALTLLIFLLGLLILWFARYAVIWIATVLAPIVFALSTFPSLEKLKSLWMDTIIPFTLMQTITALIFSIGLFLLTVTGGADSFVGGLMVTMTAIFILAASLKAPHLTTGMFKGLVNPKTLGAAGQGMGKWKEGYMKNTLTSENLAASWGEAKRKAATGGRGSILRKIPGASLLAGFRGAAINIPAIAPSHQAKEGMIEAVEAGKKSFGQTKSPEERAAAHHKKAQLQQSVNQHLSSMGSQSSPIGQNDIKRFDNILDNAPPDEVIQGIDEQGNVAPGGQIMLEDFKSIFKGARKAEGLAKLHDLKTSSTMDWTQNFKLTQKYHPKAIK